MLVVVEHGPLDSALNRARDPESAVWGLTEHLLAGAVDQLRGLVWQQGGGKGPKPKPIPRPGVGPTSSRMRVGDAMTTEEFDRRYAEKLRKAGRS